MYTQTLVALIALTFIAHPATAQGAAARLQTVLSAVPEAAFDGGQGPIIAGYGNGDAVRWIAVRGARDGVNPNTPNRFAALRSAAPNQQAIIAGAEDAAIRAATGLTPLDWVETWEVAQGAIRIGAMDIYPDSEMRLRGALFSNGFAEEDRAGLPTMWMGDDGRTDVTMISPANPFGGDLGLPLRFAFNGDRAVWSTNWTALDLALRPTGPSLAQRPDAEAVLGGLRQVGNLGGVVSVRCWLRNGAEMPITGAEAAPVEAIALADFANRETEGAALVLVLANGLDAEAMATRLRDAWPILSMLPSPAEPDIAANGSAIIVTMRSDWGEDGAATNAAYTVLVDILEAGRLGLLLNR